MTNNSNPMPLWIILLSAILFGLFAALLIAFNL